MATRPAAGGGRIVEVPPERLARWLDNFATRHGGQPSEDAIPGGVRFTAPDGAIAECALPYGGAPHHRDQLLAAASAEHRIGLLLVRRGGYAVGIAEGPRLVRSKVDRRYVQGRTAAGGQSQQRFARRRDNQARQVLEAAADLAARLLLPDVDTLDAVVVGGDRQAVESVLGQRRLAPLAEKVSGWFLPVPEPRHAVLLDAVALARMVHIRVVEPDDAAPASHP